MSKSIALKWYIEADGHDISNFVSQIEASFEHEQVDASGFSTTGNDEFLAGKTTQTITLQVFGAYGSGESWDVLYRLFRDKTVFAFKARPDSSASVSGTNPQIEGNGLILQWQGGATRGDVESFPVTVVAGDSDGFEYVTT